MIMVMISFIIVGHFRYPEPVLWIARVGILGVFYFNIRNVVNFSNIDRLGFRLIFFYIIWLLIGFLRAAYSAEGYWMWKSVVANLLVSLFYIVILFSTNIFIIQKYLHLYFKLYLPITFISVLLTQQFTLMNYLPILILMLFFGLLHNHKKILLIALVVFFFSVNFQRNDLIKILFVTVLGVFMSFYYSYIPHKLLVAVRRVLLSLPIILVILGFLGVFNPFKMDEYIKGDYSIIINTNEGQEIEDLKGDTRTFIYVNVFNTLNKYDAFIFGRSPAFGDEGVAGFWGINEETGLKGRYGNEVGILDILLWYGLIGVILYFLIYVRATYLAIHRSNSRYAKSVGIYVAFLWVWAFVWEKPMFETFFVVDLILLGLCFSKSFRAMSDNDMRIWINGIFYNSKRMRTKNKTENESSLVK